MSVDILFIDGCHTHDTWPETSAAVRALLERSGHFAIDHVRAPVPEAFSADFSRYAAVIPYYCPPPRRDGGPPLPAEPQWPAETRQALERFVEAGGGLVIIHAASNAFAGWPEYNRMIGLGGWGGRGPEAGPHLYLSERGEVIRTDGPGPAGHHEPEFEYHIDVRAPGHPIMAGMPRRWLHCRDEVYGNLRGPGERLEVLASAFSGKTPEGTQRHEPVVMTIGYGAGRVFHTTLGHGLTALGCTGIEVLLARGTEWAATGRVTLPLPSDFPTEHATASRP
jgi:type 1 glutamine amidotransferase